MQDRPKSSVRTYLNPLAQVELNNLTHDGINPTWEQVCRINHLAERVQDPQIQRVTATGTPVRLSDRLLFPLTIQASEWFVWLSEIAPEDYHTAGLLYAHEHARKPSAFCALYDLQTACKALTDYQRDLACTNLEVAVALDQLNGNKEPPKDSEKGVGFEELVASLVAKTGIEPDVWRCRVDLEYITAQVDAINRQTDTEAVRDEYLRAEKALGLALIEIRKGAENG